jgi:xylan 1,4-beta-xylosidase
MIVNPVLPGFHPDPSICRAGDDYFIATSTFQWWPGVRLHHSKDLKNWRPVGYAITRTSQLDLLGNEDSGGIWAPCLSHSGGPFYLVYTDVKAWTGAFKDCHNYLITAPSIEGPWSDPIYLNSSGFDASLFHDDDGRKWLLNMQWDHRPGKNQFPGILLQEYSPEKRTLTGPIKTIFKGTSLGLLEGPHLYKKDGWYYLLCAEGGTSWNHAVTIARSHTIDGPYEVMPNNPLLTSKNDIMLPLQRAGHGSLVQTKNGEWYMAHLTGRPIMPERRCILGRETAIQAIEWHSGDWPKIKGGGNIPHIEVPSPDLPEHPFAIDSRTVDHFDDFRDGTLSIEFNTLREPPHDRWLSLTERPGFLRLYGRESLYSKHRQSLVARRITHFEIAASTVVEFEPQHFQQSAGLIFYYDTIDYHYLHVTADENGRCLSILTCEAGHCVDYQGVRVCLEPGPVYLKGELRYGELQFFYAMQKDQWKPFGPVLDATVLSDEYKSGGKFTGAFVGVCAQDLTGQKRVADFDWFKIEKLS